MNNDHQDMENISKLADRAVALRASMGVDDEKSHWFMLISDVNKACPLRLQDMLEAPDGEFSHDAGGFLEHFDVHNKVFRDGFSPRFAA